jgi:hypothetical protein
MLTAFAMDLLFQIFEKLAVSIYDFEAPGKRGITTPKQHPLGLDFLCFDEKGLLYQTQRQKLSYKSLLELS